MTKNQLSFIVHQDDLLWMANTEAGKFLIGANSNDLITKVFHNGYERYLGRDKGRDHFVSIFHPASEMEKIFIPLLSKMDIAKRYIEDPYEALLHYSDLQRKSYKYPSLYLTISTFTANGGGQGRVNNSGVVYVTVRAALSGTASNATTRPGNGFFFGTTYEIIRGFCPFDTSALTTGASLVEGSNTFCRAVGTGANDDNDDDKVSLVASTQASDTALVDGDYDQAGTTKFANDLDIGSYSTSGNNDFVLNATGVAAINKTGYTKFAWRTSREIAGTAPASPNSVNMIDNTNLLSVEFTVAAGGTFIGNRTLLGVGR